MLNVGPGEVLVILVIALVVLGPSRLPATARTMGRVLAKVRDLVTKFQQEMQAAADAPLEAIARERGRAEQPPAASQASAAPAGTSTGETSEPSTTAPDAGETSEPSTTAPDAGETSEPSAATTSTGETSESRTPAAGTQPDAPA